MLYILENDQLRISIDDHGAQLMSIIEKTTGTEYLWQGDPTYWGDRAILLFPICGRLVEGRYTYEGKSYDMLIHGFVRHSDLVAEQTDATHVSFTMCDNEKTHAQYPFSFRFTISYTLDGNSIRHDFKVENTGDAVLPYGLGGHPGFNVPLEAGTDFSDYYLEFSEKADARVLCFSERCFLSGGSVPFELEDGKIYRMHHSMFDHDGMFLCDMAPSVTLKSDKTAKAVTVSYPNMPYLGFWHKPCTEAPYICIEPWSSLPSDDGIVDDMATKKYMNRLQPGEIANHEFTITIHK